MTMIDRSAAAKQQIRLVEALPVVGLLLAGVPSLTMLVMVAVHYVADGTL